MIVERLFVYGTLRQGSANQYAERLSKTACHIGSGTVSGRLYLVTHYPALAPAQSAEERVKGDVFEGITAELWQLLDEYEGEQYARELAQVTMDNGQTLEAYVYRYLLSTKSLKLIRSGDWHHPDHHPS